MKYLALDEGWMETWIQSRYAMDDRLTHKLPFEWTDHDAIVLDLLQTRGTIRYQLRLFGSRKKMNRGATSSLRREGRITFWICDYVLWVMLMIWLLPFASSRIHYNEWARSKYLRNIPQWVAIDKTQIAHLFYPSFECRRQVVLPRQTSYPTMNSYFWHLYTASSLSHIHFSAHRCDWL